MEYILPYLQKFTNIEVALAAIFFILFCIQIRYYIVYYRKPYNYAKRDKEYEALKKENRPKVSVVITAENESERLRENLPHILQQDYPNFQVIVVNKGSTDETNDLLRKISLEDNRLYHTYIPQSYDKSLSSRKLAFTVGIKAADGEIILFTEAYSRPSSNKWISTMVNDLHGEKEVALGYSSFNPVPSFFSKMARFDNHIFSMQYMSMALKNTPYTGTYRNLAFKKKLFFENKGFAGFLGMEGGEKMFLRSILNDRNLKVITNSDAFVESDIDSFSLWRELKKTRSYAKRHLGSATKTIFPLEYISRYLFHAVFILLACVAISNENFVLLGIGVILWLARYFHQVVVLNKSAKYFKSGKHYFSLPLYELAQPLYNIKFRSRQRRFK